MKEWRYPLQIWHRHRGRTLLRPDHKTTPKWAWPRSRDQISKFWDPLITFEQIEYICFKFGIDVDDGPLLRPDHKPTLIGRGLGHVTKFRNFGTRLLIITFERIEISASNLA